VSDRLGAISSCLLIGLFTAATTSAPIRASDAVPAARDPKNPARLVDPTRPALHHTKTSARRRSRSDLALTAILISEGRRMARLGGLQVRAGDAIGDARVLAIDRRHVRLRDRRGNFTLKLNALDVKRQRPERIVENDKEVAAPRAPTTRKHGIPSSSIEKKPTVTNPREVAAQ